MSSTKSSRDPSISIGLPVYNGAERVAAALESVLNQDFTDFEVIIADNASTDHTRMVCEEYAKRDGRVRYFRNETNIGINPNHDLVFTLSKGRYFSWFADDLEYLPGMLSHCYAAMEAATSSVALVYPLCEMVFEGESSDGCRHVSIDCRDSRPFKRL
jgi:glycosyltransferase involved in cell wall biosynthesis